jgi:hypothetical protein
MLLELSSFVPYSKYIIWTLYIDSVTNNQRPMTKEIYAAIIDQVKAQTTYNHLIC